MKCNKKWVLLVAVALAICVLCVGLAGCDPGYIPDRLDEACDLVFLKINNCTADWIDDNNLSVKVPNTSKLSLTDFILSPGAKGNVYRDAKYTQEVKDIKDIDMSTDEMEIYVKVTHNDLRQDYKVRITRSDYGERVDNRGGHKYIPEGVDKVIIEGVEYNVIRDFKEYVKLKGMDIYNENYILANDMLYDPAISINEVCFTLSNSIFDGNNYVLDWKQTMPYFGDNTGGIVRNIILDSKHNNHVSSAYWEVLVHSNSGEIYNCVNKNNYTYYMYNYFSIFGDGTGSSDKIYNCINYGNISGYGAVVGIGDAYQIINCVNLGNITSTREDKIGISAAAGISESYHVIDRCANLGIIKAKNACGITFRGGE